MNTAIDRHRPVPRLRRDRDRRRAADGGAARPAGDRSRSDRRGRASRCRRSDHSTRTLAQAAKLRRREEPSLDPLPLGRRPDAWAPAAARGRAARAGRVLPRLHDRARNAEGRDRARAVRRRSRSAAGRSDDPRASRPGNAPCHRADDGRRVHRGADARTRAKRDLPEPRLAARPRAGGERDHLARSSRSRACCSWSRPAVGTFVSPRLP